jgi:hypothetical protein
MLSLEKGAETEEERTKRAEGEAKEKKPGKEATRLHLERNGSVWEEATWKQPRLCYATARPGVVAKSCGTPHSLIVT